MTEQHEWVITMAGTVVCARTGDKMTNEEAKRRLNATESLSAEIVIQNIIIYGEGGFITDQFLDALKAYADTLEGEP